MNPALRKFIHPFLLPNGLLCAFVIFGLGHQRLPVEVLSYLEVFPYAVVAIGLFLGWRFNRTRLLYAILLLALFDLGLNYLPVGARGELIFQLIALLLPLNLLLISWFRERGLVNLRTLCWLLLLLAELLGCAWLLKEHFRTVQFYFNYPFVDYYWLSKQPLSQPLLLGNLLVLLLLAWRCLRTCAAFEVSFFWAQIVLLAGLSGLGAQPLRLYLASAGLILIMGIMESSHSLAYRDELTGLPGRRALNETLDKLGSSYSLAMLDIDHFKKFNDTHGHDVGDQVLRMVAGRLSAASGGGKAFRYGGEEFSVVFPRKSVAEAQPILERMRTAVEDARFVPRGKDRPKKKPKRSPRKKTRSTALRVTISIGAAERSTDLSNPVAVMEAADRALYRAKKAGRNRICR